MSQGMSQKWRSQDSRDKIKKATMPEKRNIALTGGGTGGHIYPCLALAEYLKEQNPEANLFYFGNPNKLESTLLNNPELKDSDNKAYRDYIKFIGVPSSALPKFSQVLKLIKWFLDFKKNTKIARSKLVENKIDFVFGTGGYAAGPVFAACAELKIPYIIHNLDAHMGLANKAFVKSAWALTLGICNLGIKPQTGRTIISGNPISKRFLKELELAKTTQKQNSKLHLLITGGSQGAQSINDAIGVNLEKLCQMDIEIVHVTGTKTYHEYLQKYLGNNPNKYPNYRIFDYTHEMPSLCAWADAGVFRAGAMTIAEITASEIVPIFVPLPWAAHDHQNKNAQSLVESGSAISLNQNDTEFEKKLLATISKLISDKEYFESMKTSLAKLTKTNAGESLASLISKHLQNKK
jgi:UDP-N-acetylglucosamine--N-acetylmuramyl-(pentapeptide) pyrophosphoryl-undecaprenol N-acetylglucosamine transferase